MIRFEINTREFSPAAKYYEKFGRYDDGDVNSKYWRDYWTEEKRRCIEGYTVGGIVITGRQYFLLNHCPIEKTIKKTINGKSVTDRGTGFPRFWDEHYNFFWLKEIAKNGISVEEYRKLNLDFEIKIEDLGGGKHIIWLKPRGVGASIIGGADSAYNFFNKKGSKTYNIANDSEFLVKDGILNKFNYIKDFINGYRYDNILKKGASGFYRNMLKTDWDGMHWRSGYIANGTEKGYLSEIMGVTLKNDYQKARGKRGIQINFEEFGKAPNIDRAWQIARPSVEEGDEVFGQLIGWGTGGTDGIDFAAMEKMFYSPEEYNCIAIRNQWDEGLSETHCCYFTPAYKDIGFIDENGNSLEERAKKHYEKQRALAKDGVNKVQMMAEKPFTPKDAMLNTGSNPFVSAELKDHITHVENLKRLNTNVGCGLPVDLVIDSYGAIKYNINYENKPIDKYPLDSGDKKQIDGCVMIFEPPYKDKKTGEVPNNLYYICHDPYAQDESDATMAERSLGATYVMENINNLTRSKGDLIVAAYIGRPNDLDTYNSNLFKLSKLYNAPISIEFNRGTVKDYALRFKMLDRLQKGFTFAFLDNTGRKASVSQYGMNMTKERKSEGILYLRDWLYLPRAEDINTGRQILNLHTIYDLGLLYELDRWSGGNADRISALLIGMYAKKELEFSNRKPDLKSSSIDKFFNHSFFQ